MIKITFILAIFSFIVILEENNNASTQLDESTKRQGNISTVANLTDQLKFRCIQIDASGAIDQIENKEQQAECKKFLDNVSIDELKVLIEKYIEKHD
jgi:uncharacterized protein YqfB (UPF0267 family)